MKSRTGSFSSNIAVVIFLLLVLLVIPVTTFAGLISCCPVELPINQAVLELD
jgi:hypothetical protein